MTRPSSIPSLHVEKLEDRCNPSTLDPSAGALADRPSIDAHAGQTIKILSQPLDPAGADGATTVADDVWVDGKIITGQNFDTARRHAGQSIQILIEAADTASAPGAAEPSIVRQLPGPTNYDVGAQAEVGEIRK